MTPSESNTLVSHSVGEEDSHDVLPHFQGGLTVCNQSSWQGSLRAAIRSSDEILRWVGIEPPETELKNSSHFSPFATREFLSRVIKGDRNDPLLLQVLPVAEEETANSGLLDPVGDGPAEILPGLLHKYEGRVLLVATGACAIHCRYCFRQHYPYSGLPKSTSEWIPALKRIQEDSSIREVILSGGDPLMLVDEKLAWLVRELDAIPHLRRLRIHTRLPVMIPQRVCPSLLEWLSSTRLSSWMVLHINHANEIDRDVSGAVDRLKKTGCQLLNQSVLLRGVNDSVEALVSLSESLVDLGIVPYYLHQLDPVQGASHFEVPVEQGRDLVSKMRARLPGYAVPRYVAEIAGESHKSLLL